MGEGAAAAAAWGRPGKPGGAEGGAGGWQRTLLEGISEEQAFNERLRAAAERLAAQRLE